MKKKIAIGLSFIMVLSMCVGCGKKSSQYLMNIDYSKYVTVCDYQGIPASKVTFEISEDEIKQRIDEDLYAYVTYDVITDRAAKEGDFVNIDYKGSIDGVELAEYTDSSIDLLLGEGFFFGEAETQIAGMKSGDKKKIDIELDETTAINEDNIGKTLSIDVTLNEISVEHLPEYNDDFVKTNMGFENTGVYEETLKQELEDGKKEQYKVAAMQEILNYIYDNSVFDKYPQELYDQCEKNFDTLNTQYAEQLELNLEEYLDLYDIDSDTRNEILIEEVNYRLIIGAIAQKENIDCTPEEIEEFAQSQYEEYGYENAADFQQEYGEKQIGYEVIYKKVVEFLYDNANFTEISETEYMDQQMGVDEDASLDEINLDDSELVTEPIDMDDMEIEVIQDTEEIENNDSSEE